LLVDRFAFALSGERETVNYYRSLHLDGTDPKVGQFLLFGAALGFEPNATLLGGASARSQTHH
jgi:hypothetical protein